MQIKAADDKQPQIDALSALLARPDVDAATRRQIETEIRRIRAARPASATRPTRSSSTSARTRTG